MEKELRCKASTDANKLAYSIYSAYQKNQDDCIRIRVVGAGALNQATKSVIISNKYLIKKGVIEPVGCGKCPSCRKARKCEEVVSYKDFFQKGEDENA